jgi:hypothetical protein
VISIIPFIKLFLPAYEQAITPFSLLLLVQLVIAYLFGHPVFLIARGKEGILTFFAGIAIFLNIFFGYIIYRLGVSFQFVPFVTIFSVIVYVVLVRFYSERLLKGVYVSIIGTMHRLPLLKFIIPMILILFLNFFEWGYRFYFLGFALFILLGFKNLKEGMEDIIGIIKNNFI